MRWLVIISSLAVVVVVLRHYLQLRMSVSCANATLRDQKHRMLEQDRYAALGGVTAGIAHELATPIGAARCTHATHRKAVEKMRGMMESAAPDMGDDEAYARCVSVLDEGDRIIEAGLEQASALIEQLRAFSVRDRGRPEPVDVADRIDGALLMIRNQTKNRIEVRRDFADCPPLVCYPVKLTQILLNLLSNAAQAIPDQGAITVITASDDDHVEIRIADDGTGIPADVRDRIFEFGYTTRTESGGTGLGLAIVAELVSMHHGTIDVESEPGAGTTFSVRLPRDLDRRLDEGCGGVC